MRDPGPPATAARRPVPCDRAQPGGNGPDTPERRERGAAPQKAGVSYRVRMGKRWAAWPPAIRWLAGTAAVVLAAAVVWALFVPLADWLARQTSAQPEALQQTARDAARGRLLTLGAGLFAAGALLFTARNFALSREGQVTDRYTKAIEQLGSKEARRAHRRHLRPRAGRPGFRQRPPDRDGGAHRIHPRALPRAVAARYGPEPSPRTKND